MPTKPKTDFEILKQSFEVDHHRTLKKLAELRDAHKLIYEKTRTEFAQSMRKSELAMTLSDIIETIARLEHAYAVVENHMELQVAVKTPNEGLDNGD